MCTSKWNKVFISEKKKTILRIIHEESTHYKRYERHELKHDLIMFCFNKYFFKSHFQHLIQGGWAICRVQKLKAVSVIYALLVTYYDTDNFCLFVSNIHPKLFLYMSMLYLIVQLTAECFQKIKKECSHTYTVHRFSQIH